jgi:glycosyltransferase involved in cell wall biosynthesis
MEFTKNSPIQMDIVPIPDSILPIRFIIKGSKRVTNINICVHVHFKNPIHSNMVDVVTSDILNIHTYTYDKAYRALIKIPKFKSKDRTKSYVIFLIDQNDDPYAKVCIEDIIIEDTIIEDIIIEEIDKSIIEEIPIPKNLTISDMIDLMISRYDINLPKDLQNRISYIYPVYKADSFHIVASNHTKYLRHKYLADDKHVEIEEIDWFQLATIDWKEKRNILIHPFLYPFASPESFKYNLENFAKLLSMKNKIAGFDVADSNRISNLAVDLVNKIDLMMVPSTFAKNAYIKSGVDIPIEILPHGIVDEFIITDPISDQRDGNTNIYSTHANNISTNNNNMYNNELIKLIKMKQDGNILVLYFLIHSEHRKGADLVKNVMKRIQNKFRNVYLVVKSKNTAYFSDIRSVNITSWMDNNDLRLLYDTCDICLSPSRGGGFELNALEAISRGIPTLVTNGCCFTDLINYFIPIDLSRKIVQPLPGNAIHIGTGCEVDINDFDKKLTDVINRLDYWKEYFRNNSNEIKEKYSWRNTADMLNNYLIQYGFIYQ